MKKFGKIENETLILAPKSGIIDNVMYSRFTEQQYKEMGYKEVIDNEPIAESGFNVVFDGYDETDDLITIKYKQVEKILEPNNISKLKLRIALMKLGLWEAIVEWMKQTEITIEDGIVMTCYEAWNDALVIDTNSSLFAPYLELAKKNFEDKLVGIDINQILENCKAE